MNHKIKVLFLIFLFFLPTLSFAGRSKVDIMLDAIEWVIGSGPSRGMNYRGWQYELDDALRALAFEHQVDSQVIESIRMELKTPQKTISFLRKSNSPLGARLANLQWEQILKILGRLEKEKGTQREAAFVFRSGLWAQRRVLIERLDQFYQDKILSLIQKIQQWVPLQDSILVEKLERLKALFSDFLISNRGIAERQSHTYMMIKNEIKETCLAIEERISFLEHPHPEMQVNREVSELFNGHIFRIKELMAVIKRFEIRESVTAGLRSRAESVIPDFEDLLWANVYFGSLEEQKIALYYLIEEARSGGGFISRQFIQEALTIPNPVFRKAATGIFIERGIFTKEARAFLEAELSKTYRLCSDQAEFLETIEVMVNVLLGTSEKALKEMIYCEALSPIVRRGAVRTLGQLSSPQSYHTLMTAFGEIAVKVKGERGAAEWDILKTIAEELKYKVKISPQYFEDVEAMFLKAFRFSTEPMGQSTSVEALGMLWEGSEEARHAHTLLSIFMTSNNPFIEYWALEALSKVGYLDTEIVEKLTPHALKHSNINVRIAAAVCIEPKLREQMVPVFAQVLEPNAMREVQEIPFIRAIKSIEKYAPDLALLREKIWRCTQPPYVLSVRLEALLVLARKQDEEAAFLLVQLFDEAGGSQKVEIIRTLLTRYERPPMIKEALLRVLTFYRDPKYSFDFLESFDDKGYELVQKFRNLKGDLEVIELLQAAEKEQALPHLQYFSEVVLPLVQ